MKFKGGGRFVLTSCNKCHLSVARPRAVVTRDGRCARFLDTRRGTPILPSFRLVVSNNDQESSRFSRVMLFFPNSLYYSTRFCLFCRVRRFRGFFIELLGSFFAVSSLFFLVLLNLGGEKKERGREDG